MSVIITINWKLIKEYQFMAKSFVRFNLLGFFLFTSSRY